MNPELISQLQQACGNDAVITDNAECWPYGIDNSRRQHAPDVVVMPQQHEQVQAVVAVCFRHRVPLVCRGRGTGTAGAAVPLQGGVVLSTERMNRILRMDPVNRLAVVQPGVTNQEVQDAARRHGLFWAPDPTSAEVCTVGGNLACNAAGPLAVKYGTTRDNVLGLRAVTGDGSSLRTGVFTSKGVVGYDLTRLIIGSEGTLAVITEATLRLLPLPEARQTLRAVYHDIASATEAIVSVMALPDSPCVLEFIDGKAIELANRHTDLGLPAAAGAMLMLEVDGNRDSISVAATRVQQAASNGGLLELRVAQDDAEAKQLWRARKALSPALRHIAPKKINEDVVVPVGHLPELINGLEKLSKQYNITIVNFGHAGNGNIHVNLLVDPDDAQQMTGARQCLADVFALVLQLEGTLSGEHGIGSEKKDYVGLELDTTSLELMRRIKQQFDPAGILNPGKLFPE
jgi:D-lactate dehydrogenase